MLPRLQAEEQLRAIEATGLGMGNYEKSEASEMLGRLRERAFGEVKRTKLRADPAQLAAIGIGMRQVPQKVLSDV